LVDDATADRELLREAFIHRGAHVTEAAMDSDAYAALEAAGDRFDLLVTDINLGAGVTGFDIARAARQRRPEIPVIYMTAYQIVTGPHVVANSRVMRKPMKLAEVADAALDFLASQPSGFGPDAADPLEA
jgi:CheY-like chemotaxis protein